MRQDDLWTAMADNERIEGDYCDPKNMHRYFLYSANVLCLISISHETFYRNIVSICSVNSTSFFLFFFNNFIVTKGFTRKSGQQNVYMSIINIKILVFSYFLCQIFYCMQLHYVFYHTLSRQIRLKLICHCRLINFMCVIAWHRTHMHIIYMKNMN